MENVLLKILQEKITVVGCGRTDAGVHASQFIAHMDTSREIPPDFIKICNHLFNENIALLDTIEVPPTWHARYDATERQYDYFLHLEKDPFLKGLSAYYPIEYLHYINMSRAIESLNGNHDFAFLCRQPEKYNYTNCNMKKASINVSECGYRFHFQFVADRFLRGMIRIIVAKLIDVGRGAIDVRTFQNYIAGKEFI